MQTAVEWLDRWFRDNPKAEHQEGNEALHQAKEMEKQQIIDAYRFGLSDEYVIGSEQYYTKTYGSKGSDDTPMLDRLKAHLDSITPEQFDKEIDDIVAEQGKSLQLWECCGMEECICKGSDETKQ